MLLMLLMLLVVVVSLQLGSEQRWKGPAVAASNKVAVNALCRYVHDCVATSRSANRPRKRCQLALQWRQLCTSASWREHHPATSKAVVRPLLAQQCLCQV
jgi:hypothetical protein